jgi:hypothetical protein
MLVIHSAQAMSKHSVARHARTTAVAEAKQQQPQHQQQQHNGVHSELLLSQTLSSLQRQQQQQAELSESKRCDAKLDYDTLRGSSEHASRINLNIGNVHDYSDSGNNSHNRATSAPVTPAGSRKPGIKDLQQVIYTSVNR